MRGWRCWECIFLERCVLEVKFIFLTRQNSIWAIILALNLFSSVSLEAEGTAKGHLEGEWFCQERDAHPWRGTGAWGAQRTQESWGWHKGCRNGESRFSASALVQLPIYSLKQSKVTSLEWQMEGSFQGINFYERIIDLLWNLITVILQNYMYSVPYFILLNEFCLEALKPSSTTVCFIRSDVVISIYSRIQINLNEWQWWLSQTLDYDEFYHNIGRYEACNEGCLESMESNLARSLVWWEGTQAERNLQENKDFQSCACYWWFTRSSRALLLKAVQFFWTITNLMA